MYSKSDCDKQYQQKKAEAEDRQYLGEGECI